MKMMDKKTAFKRKAVLPGKRNGLCKRKSSSRGFTLIEVLASIAILAVIAGSLSIFIFQSLTLYNNELENNADESKVRDAMSEIVNTMRKVKSDDITTEYNTTLYVGGTEYICDGNNLLKNGNVWIKEIKGFTAEKGTAGVEIAIESTDGRTVETTFALR